MTVTDRKVTAKRVVLISLGAFLMLAGLLAVGTPLAAGAKTNCLQEGPFSPEALVSESNSVVRERLVAWPAGRECVWRRADGAGKVATYSGSPLASGIGYGAIVAGLVTAVAGATYDGCKRGATR